MSINNQIEYDIAEINRTLIQLTPLQSKTTQCHFCQSISNYTLAVTKDFLEGKADQDPTYRFIECPKCGNYVYSMFGNKNYNSQAIAIYLRDNYIFGNEYYYFGDMDFFNEHFLGSPVIHYISPKEVYDHVLKTNEAISLNSGLDNIKDN